MSKTPNITKQFILSSFKKNLRLDGRKIADTRQLSIKFGKKPGQI